MNEYFKNDALAEQVWKDKYKLKDETLDDFFERIASEFARLDNTANTAERVSDEDYEELSQYGKDRLVHQDKKKLFLSLFKDFKYIIPGGSVLAGVGTGKPVSLSNCFVTPTDDSIADIFNTARDMSQIYKRRGGNGTDLSLIRPAKAVVNNAAKTTGGVVPFMELYSQVTNTIGQDGRRGALMISIDIRHPDSPQFITSKQDLSKITGANISVKIDDDFMKLVESDGDYILKWPVTAEITKEMYLRPYNELFCVDTCLSEGTNGSYKFTDMSKIYHKKIKAKELWDSIIKCAHATAEPGILFWDTILNNDPASVYPEFKAISTNPCGEIPLSAYDSCRLIAVNLYNLVNDKFTLNAKIDEKLAYKVFYEAQIIGDILVDLEIEHVQRIIDLTDGDEKKLWMKIRDIGMKGRRTGVGITGYADMLAALGLPYGEKVTTDWIMNLKMKAELDASIDLAIINGAFPSYNKYLEYEFIPNPPKSKGMDEYIGKNKFYEFILKEFPYQIKKMQKYGRRNVSWSTIAPTGTISMLAKTSSGCEPVFSLYYKRRKKCNPGETADFIDSNGIGYTEHNVIHGSFKDWYNEVGFLTIEASTDISTLTLDELDKSYELSPWYNNCANDIKSEVRIKTQAILQKYTTHSISSTINLPSDTPIETIDNLYMMAWKHGLKGVTVNI